MTQRIYDTNWINNSTYNPQLEAVKVDIVNCGCEYNDLSHGIIDQLIVLQEQLDQIIGIITPPEIIYPVPVPAPALPPPVISPVRPKPIATTPIKPVTLKTIKNEITIDLDLKIIKVINRKPIEKIFYNICSVNYDNLIPVKNVPIKLRIRNRLLLDQIWSFSSTKEYPGYYFLYLSGTTKTYRYSPYILIDVGRYVEFFPLNGRKSNIIDIKK